MTRPPCRAGTALHTDHYELTMLDAALRGGRADHRAVFEVFARRLPHGRRYGVLAGVDRVVEAVGRFRFGDDELGWLSDAGVVGDAALERLAAFRFSGRVDAYAEGEVFLPDSPVATVEAPFAEAVLLETLVLSVLNHDAAIASAASRMVTAAAGRPLTEMGSRRTDPDAAVAAARAAYVAGFAATSNLAAGARYGIPTLGTSAHAFVLAFPDEAEAFAAQVGCLGAATTLLVDTYDTTAAIETAVAVAGTGLGGVRIDSGDLGEQARRARVQLDALGATGTRIVLTGDLDEHGLADLAGDPVDAFGVGTALVTGSGAPTAELVYKLVAVADEPGPRAPLRPVEKRSGGKATHGGRKTAWRVVTNGTARAEVLRVGGDAPQDARPLQVAVVVDGERVRDDDLDAARTRHEASVAELPPQARRLDPGPCAVPTDLPEIEVAR